MRLRLKTKITLTTALLVLGVVALISGVYVARLTRQVLEDAELRAKFVAQQIFLQAQHALQDSADRGETPATDRLADLRDFVRLALEENAGLTSLIDAAVGYSPTIYEVTIVDQESVALVSSDASLPGRLALPRTPLDALIRTDFLEKLRILFGPERVYQVTYSFNLADQPFGEVRVALSSVLLRTELAPGLRQAALLAVVALVVLTAFAALLSHLTLAPLQRISEQLDRIATGRFEPDPRTTARLARRHDEFGSLSLKINALGEQLREVRGVSGTREEKSLERIAWQLKLRQREAEIARITRNVAHEVKNPLNSMRLWVENLRESLGGDSGASREALHVLDTEIERLDRVVKRFLDFMRPVELRPEPTRLADVLQDVLRLERPQMERNAVELETQLDADLPPAQLDRVLIQQALHNLVGNAIEAMPHGGKLTVGLRRNAEMAVVSISDTGLGIKPEHRDHIFQLFFTTRPDGNGLGLATTYRVVKMHEGLLEFTSELGRGTTFRVELPLARADELAAAPEASKEIPEKIGAS
jgi:signal transduction histidine kinase